MKPIRRTLFVLVLLAAPFLAPAAITSASEPEAAERWPGFRLDGSGVAPPTAEVPMAWSEETLLWKTAIEGRGHSSPAVWGDRVFVTTAVEGEVIEGAGAPVHTLGGQEFKHPDALGSDRRHTMKVIALDAGSGEVVWSRVAHDGQVFDDRHKDSSYASPSPVTDGERIYAYFGSEGVYAYDFAGELAWKQDIGDIKTVGMGVGTSPVLWRELLIIQADEDSGEESFIVALDKGSGEEVWRRSRPVQVSWATPIVVEHDGEAQLVTSGTEWVIAYDPASGEEIWRAPGLQSNAIHSPLVHDDLVILTAGYPAKVAFAVRLGRKGELGEDDYVWKYEKGTAYMPSNLLYDGLLYLTNDGGVLTALDPKTGEVVYEGGRSPIRGRYSASLLGVDGKIVMVNSDGDAAFIAAGSEHEVLGETSIDEPVWATPAIVGNRIYVRGIEHLYAFGKGEG